jgi:hypothetical protein
MFSSHTAIVLGLDDVRAALRPGHRRVLLSAEGAGAWAGCLWWRALIDRAHAEFPGQVEADVLDCADAPGHAMAALRSGCRWIVLDPACPATPAVRAAAATLGAVVLDRMPGS